MIRAGAIRRLWPTRLGSQMMLVMALALLLAQAISAALLYRAEMERRQDMIQHRVTFRLIAALRDPLHGGGGPGEARRPPRDGGPAARETVIGGLARALSGPPPPPPPLDSFDRGRVADTVATFAPQPGDIAQPAAERAIRAILAEETVPIAALHVYRRALDADAEVRRHLAHHGMLYRQHHLPPPDYVLVTGLQVARGGPWLVTREIVLAPDPVILANLIMQTVLIYAALIVAMALILRRISRPLAALTGRVNRFGAGGFGPERDGTGQLPPAGPQDIRRLIEAHNAMERRILALLDEKDVMLGAIGHDLKTPLTALRVRIESVEDPDERGRMARTIDDIASSLDDMLSLARVGRPTDPIEVTALQALVASVVEEYEDLGEPVTFADAARIALPLRATWLRRALRNLIGNALRYGGAARVSLMREESGGEREPRRQWAVIRIDDEGPGIAAGDIDRMMEPFTRGEPSRNSETGGAGLGLTLARAIAEQHGGTLTLANRGERGACAGLTASLRLPIP